MTVILIILAAVAFLLISHFCALPISDYYRQKSIENLLPLEIVRSPRWYISLTSSKDLMITYTHLTELDADDYYNTPFARYISVTFGGLYIAFYFGHTFNSQQTSDKYFGFHSIDGEKFWRGAFFYDSYFDNPFLPTRSLGHFVYDYNENKYTSTRVLDHDTTLYPYIMRMSPAKYKTKSGEVQDVQEIMFWVSEHRVTYPVFYYLGLGNCFYKRYTSIEFEVNDPDGLGDERHTWKGGVMQAECFSISDDPVLNHQFKTLKKQPHKLRMFINEIERRILDWMHHGQEF